MSPQNMDPNVGTLNAPNTFSLTGHGLSIEYATTSIDGKATFSYKDANGGNFLPTDEFTVEETAFGTLVTCMTKILVDVGSNSLTLILPRINVEQGQEQTFETIAIQTHNTTTLLHAGARQSYEVVKLSGTARFVTP